MKSFTVRTTLWFAGLVTATVAVVLVAGGGLLNRQMIRGLELLHEVEALEMAELLEPGMNLTSAEVRERIAHDADADAELFFIQVHDQTGAIRFRSGNLGLAMLPDLSEQEAHRTVDLPGIGSVRMSEFYTGGWHIQIGSRLLSHQRVLQDYAQVAGLLLLGVAAASVGLGWGFSRLTLRPIRAIERTARHIGADNLTERIPVPPGGDELAALSRLLNETFDRIERAFAQVRQFTGDASHELKTPLALIRLNVEKIRPRVAPDAEVSAALDDVLEEIERLNQIIEALLFLSKAESGVLTVQRQALSVPAWLQEWAQDAEVLAEDRGCRFELQTAGDGRVEGVSPLLGQLLFNLLTNALKASPPGATVTLRATREERAWVWRMIDEGPGLPETQLMRVFDRFVRYDPVNGGNRGSGHGLGLAICRSIAELHHGSIRAVNRRDRPGLEVEVRLPDPSG